MVCEGAESDVRARAAWEWQAAMGCCGSTVRVQEIKHLDSSSDEESEAGELHDEWFSDTALKIKAEARSMFTMVDAGACPIELQLPAFRVFPTRR